MKAFGNGEHESVNNPYEKEVRERWGNTDAYRGYKEKTKGYTREKWESAADGMMGIFAEFAACMNDGEAHDSGRAQALAEKLQTHITGNYYNCTDEIFAGLGQMYVCDERFKKNIDKCGEGTARFASDAIRVYCGNKRG